MSRKLFISFLGTGFYRECTYYDANGAYTYTRFIQQATLEQIGTKTWNVNDAARIFITDKAFEENWDGTRAMRYDPIAGKEVQYTRLEQIISDMRLPCDVRPILHVPVGNNEEEMWQIFQMVYNEIHDGDELYIDLTHAFRYLPMLVLVLSNYAKFLKHITIKHLSYGNWEGRDKTANHALIVDLLPLTMLQDWTSAAAEFIKHGYAESLKTSIKTELTPLLRDNSRCTKNVRNVNKLGANLDSFAAERIVCRGLDISHGKAAESLLQQLNSIEDTGIAPLNPIFKKLKATTTIPDNIPSRCYKAAEWCYKRQLYQQAITILQEGINTFFCLRHNIDIDDEDNRSLIGQAFHISEKKLVHGITSSESVISSNLHLNDILDDELILNEAIVHHYTDLSGTRNDFNHAGFRKKRKPLSASQIKRKIEGALEFFKPVLTNGDFTMANHSKPGLFINLSNHPSSKWDGKQKDAAEMLGEIIDINFPIVPPNSTSSEVEAKALDVEKRILDYGRNYDLTVHVMGELNLTYALVNILKADGIRCVASTTNRIVKDLGNGKKVVLFDFVRFREY